MSQDAHQGFYGGGFEVENLASLFKTGISRVKIPWINFHHPWNRLSGGGSFLSSEDEAGARVEDAFE